MWHVWAVNLTNAYRYGTNDIHWFYRCLLTYVCHAITCIRFGNNAWNAEYIRQPVNSTLSASSNEGRFGRDLAMLVRELYDVLVPHGIAESYSRCFQMPTITWSVFSVATRAFGYSGLLHLIRFIPIYKYTVLAIRRTAIKYGETNKERQGSYFHLA